MPVDHPVLPIGADLQLEGGDVVRFLRFLWNGTLGSDACKDFQSMEVHLLARKKCINIQQCFNVLTKFLECFKWHKFQDILKSDGKGDEGLNMDSRAIILERRYCPKPGSLSS